REAELYKNSPVEVIQWEPGHPGAGLYGMLSPTGQNGYSLTLDETEVYQGEFDKPLILSDSSKLVLANVGGREFSGNIRLIISAPERVAIGLSGQLGISEIEEWGSALRLSLNSEVPQKAVDVLN